jgi:signal transduction histidine kinase
MLNRTRHALFDRYLGISRLLAGHLDFNAIIQAVAAEISHIIPHDHLDVCIKTMDGKYHIAYESGPDTAWSKQPPALLTGSPIRTLLAGEVDFLLSDDACSDPRFHFAGAFSSPIIDLSLRSRLHVPLKVQGNIIGALSCSSHERGAYTMEDVECARSIADLLAPYFFALRAAEQAKRSAVVETEARAREEGLRLGALKLTEALEAERQRIGMDLHDQTLADLTRLARRMERLAGQPDMPADVLEPLCRTLQQCMHDLRQIIEEAKPTVLQLFGVAEAIENHVDRSVRESGLPIHWRVTDDSDGMLTALDQSVAISLFRIVQEAVNNAIRHAQPTMILVRIVQSGHRLLGIEVVDDGCGVGTSLDEGGGAKAGHGIDNMKTRARLISAKLEMGGNRDGQGTIVKLSLPVEQKALEEAGA